MDTNFYDVIVCGAEFAGVVAAALLGRRGLRVLLVGHDGERPTLDAAGVTLSRGPALLPPLDAPPVARVLHELSLVQMMRRRAPALSPGFQVALPRHRFDVTADQPTFAREIGREWPAESDAIAAVTARMTAISALVDPLLATELTLPPDGFWERREVGRIESLLPRARTDPFAPLPTQHPFRAVAMAPAVLGSGFGPGDIGTVTLCRAFEHARRGLHRLEGGQSALWSLFLEKIETFSGERREKVLPVEIVQRRGRAIGLRVRPRNETIGCHTLVWAGSAAAALPLLGDGPSRKARDAALALRPVCYRYTLALLVRPEAIAEGMSSRVFFIDDPGRALIEENALAVTVGQPNPRDPDRVPLWIDCLVPAPAVEAGPGHLSALRGRIRERLGRLIPFFDEHLIALGSPYDGLPPEVPGIQGRLQPMSVEPMPAVYSAEQIRAFDPSGISHGALGVKNLFVLGRENLPGLGMEGEFVAAWGLVRLVTAAQPRRDLLRRQILVGES
jgi:phytoene dehydrogenase-like protein